ncbi:MAG: hemolysin III family protein [Spirochaetes bacterium]|nr:hemolysin III family protein [Spirochaetota bacterium]
MEKTARLQSRGEELANAFTHALGAALGVAGLAVLVTAAAERGDAWKVVSFSVFGAAMVLLYTMSTLYHLATNERVKNFLHILDHASIFLLIAGSYTPVSLVTMRGAWGWSIFGVVWGIAIVGIILKIFFTGRFRTASTILYLAMGWLIVVAIKPLLTLMPPAGLYWFLAGGLSYSLGTIFYMWKSLRYGHAVWHLFVLGGTVCHFFGVYYQILPMS